ncbi:ABC transporter permease [Staphylococcus lutrae]|uniref:ABC transporter permease n=3 Tax=Staphylococcus lutrae TaxID=155085 RepID=A0AAC9WN11_9STAP|nr:ABC transporter permease [Staphylococcus lutrae]
MIKSKQLLFLIQLNVKRNFRDFKYVCLIILLPTIFYIIYSEIFPKNANIDGTSWVEYSLISLISFGIMGNAINLLGTRVASEKKDNWYNYLKVSPIKTSYYLISHLFTYLLISILFTILMFVIAYFWNGVHIELTKVFYVTLALNIGSFVFLFLALIIGQLGSIAQSVGTIVYLILSFLGGLWMPVAAMPSNMQGFAKTLPSYNYAKLGWDIVAGNQISWASVLTLIIYSFVFLVVFLYLSKREKKY